MDKHPGDADPRRGPTRLTKYRRQRPDQRKRALMDATMRCLAERGIERTSIRSISEEAGVSVGLVNHYYASKEALIAEVYAQVADDLLTALQDEVARVAAADRPGRARLSAFFRASFSEVNLDSGLLRIWLAFWTMAQQSEAIAEVHTRTYRDYRRTLERLLQELSAEVPGAALDVRLAAIGLSGLLDGLWLEWCLNPATFSPDEGMRLCEDFLDGLLAHGQPRERCT
jgi:AcrR family transcriptional regulator